MNFGIDFLNPIYWVFIGIIFIAILAYWLYILGQKSQIPFFLRTILFLFRFLALSLVMLLLLKPIIKINKNNVEKPIVPIFIDNSKSINLQFNTDSFNVAINKFKENLLNLNNDIDFKFISFGDKINGKKAIELNEKQTDISQIFNYIDNNFSGKNLAAIVLLSDGNYNKGSEPTYLAESSEVPFFTIGLGSENRIKDASIEKIIYNKIAYKNTKAQIKINISAYQLAGKKTVLKISKDNKIIYSVPIYVKSNNYFTEKIIELDIKETEIITLDIELLALQEEKNKKNNSRKIAIKVEDKKTKWLILGSSPHPDMAAFYKALSTNLNFEVKSSLLSKYNKNFKPDAIILHQLPDNSSDWTNFAVENDLNNIPKLIIVGKNTIFKLLNKYNWGQQTTLVNKQIDFSQAEFNSLQSLISFEPIFNNLVREESQVTTLYTKYQLSSDATILLYRVFKDIITKDPLLVSFPSKKSIFLNATGIWKWAVNDYVKNGTQSNFQDFVNKIASHLLTKRQNKTYLKYKNIVEEGETIVFDFFNADSLILKTNPKIKINNSIYSFKKISELHYRTSFYSDSLGSQNFIFEAIFENGKKYRENSSYYCTQNFIEYQQSKSNLVLLRQIAYRSNGSYLHWENKEHLMDSINSKVKLRSIITQYTQVDDFIHLKSLFFIILILLILEWAVRKYFSLD